MSAPLADRVRERVEGLMGIAHACYSRDVLHSRDPEELRVCLTEIVRKADAYDAVLARLRAFREYLDLAPGSPITIGRICAAFDADFPEVRDEPPLPPEVAAWDALAADARRFWNDPIRSASAIDIAAYWGTHQTDVIEAGDALRAALVRTTEAERAASEALAKCPVCGKALP